MGLDFSQFPLEDYSTIEYTSLLGSFPCQPKFYFAWYNHIILSYIFLKSLIKKILSMCFLPELVDNYCISLSIVALVKLYIFSYFNIFL